MWQILCWSVLSKPVFSYLQQKRRYDVICDIRYLCCFWATRGTNGLSGTFENRFFLKFHVFRSQSGRKVHFEQVCRKKVNFRPSINPLEPRDFSKIRENSVSNLWVKMAIKWRKMLQMSWFKDQNVANFMLISFEQTGFSISPTEKTLWRHMWHTVFLLLWSNTGH